MELLFSCLILFLISIGAGRLLGVYIDRKSVAKIKSANRNNPKKDSVFLKKYKQVDVDQWKTTTKLAGLSLAIGFLLLSAETYKKKNNIRVEEKIIVPIDDELTEWIDADMEIPEPPPSIEMPPPPPPPPIPVDIIEVEAEIEEEPKIIAPEPSPEPIPKPMPSALAPPLMNTTPPVITPPPAPKPVNQDEMSDTIIGVAEVMPEFEGGINKLRRQVGKNYKPPKHFKGTGKVITRFVVLEDGSIGEVQILKGIDSCDACSEEAIRAIKKVKGRFSPGKQAGKPVKVWFTLPIQIEVR